MRFGRIGLCLFHRILFHYFSWQLLSHCIAVSGEKRSSIDLVFAVYLTVQCFYAQIWKLVRYGTTKTTLYSAIRLCYEFSSGFLISISVLQSDRVTAVFFFCFVIKFVLLMLESNKDFVFGIG